MAKPKLKTTITVDESKLTRARELAGARSASAAIDAALTAFIRDTGLLNDIAIYSRTPAAALDVPLENPVRLDLGDDDVDYDALYGSSD